MKPAHCVTQSLVVLTLALTGCGGASTAKSITSAEATHFGQDAEVKANLAKLSSADDRAIAEAQTTCPVSREPLGSMGVPVKVMIEGQPVFLCCKSCEKRAKADPAKTLARVKELKGKGASQ